MSNSVVRRTAQSGWLIALGLVLMMGLWLFSATISRADGPQDDLERINAHLDKAMSAAQAGNVSEAQQEYKSFKTAWLDVEDGVRAVSKDAYKDIEQKMALVDDAFAKSPADPQAINQALENLDETGDAFIKATPTGQTSQAESNTTVASVLEMVDKARDYQVAGNYSAAAAQIKQFKTSWLDVEGQVKTRSTADYTETENDMNLAYDLLNQNSPKAKEVLDRMYSRLQPYGGEAQRFGIADSMLIILREGLEALLVVVALLAFLKKSGNDSKQGWVWAGVGVGLAASVALALAIQLIFSNLINPSNRELIEGVVGLVAAGMLIYVSYWMHSKASAGAWQRYIKQKSTAALAKGSLFGLALLSFLAIFREGAETSLFYLGMGSSISTSDLLIGLGLGFALLGGLGFLLIVVGVRIPMGPFFTVASLVVFFLCYKFIGMGVHALQIAGILPAHSADYLPQSEFFGMYQTWETTLVQALLLAVGIGVVVISKLRENAERGASNPAAPSPAK